MLSLFICFSIVLVEDLLSADINEVDLRESIRRGSQFLYNNQDATGWWSDPDLPALTGLALVALKMAKAKDLDRKYESERMRAYDYLTSLVKPDGTIHAGRLINYNTACSLMAFSVIENDRYQSIIRKARASIANSQIDLGEKGKLDKPHDGGVGYNSKYDHSDMNNTLMAVEAMRMSEMALRGSEKSANRPVVDLDWKALEHFLASCQNLPERSNNPNLSKNIQDRGGFIYHPGESKAGEVVDEKSKRVALRSYGSISYAGMMSFAYARIGKDDERVKAVMAWLGDNYTLEENPGMGQEGLYYYFHLMAKSLSAQGVDKLKVADGRLVNWKRDLAKRLVSLQNPDGSWKNSNKRWMEGDPILTTSYVLVALSLLSE
ncbi:MAG: cycloartenol synthase [Verrucomicrobiales bacterium]|nr:cycloartenol synthase [Verrucomicrobiales bacterium]